MKIKEEIDAPYNDDQKKYIGIGLRGVSERLKGYFGKACELTIESEVGKGTKITILIPKRGDLKTMDKVVIVEDDRIIRRSLSIAPWKQHGFVLAGEAADGESALEIIEKEQPQVVVSDISMPFMNGLDMARSIKETSPHTKVIFLTGYEDFKYAQKAVQLKAFDYLLKPVKISDLIGKSSKCRRGMQHGNCG